MLIDEYKKYLASNKNEEQSGGAFPTTESVSDQNTKRGLSAAEMEFKAFLDQGSGSFDHTQNIKRVSVAEKLRERYSM